MPEPTDTLTPNLSVTPTDIPVSNPAMPDPQKLVDEALNNPGNPNPAPAVAPVPPMTEKTVTETPTETVPSELLGASPVAPVEPVVTPEPSPTPTPSPSAGEEMPLAFAGAAPTLTPAVETKDEPVKPAEPTPAEPTFTPPPPSMTPPKPEKKKKKTGKILAAIVGFFLLVGAAVGGYYYYANTFGEGITVAEVAGKTESSCTGGCDSGHKTKWKNGKCVWTSKPCEGGGTGGTAGSQITSKDQCNGCSPDGFEWKWHSESNSCGKSATPCGVNKATGEYVSNSDVESATDAASCNSSGSGQWCEATDANGRHYAFCMRNDGSQGNCNDKAAEKGYVVQEGVVKCKCTQTDGSGNCTQYDADLNDPAYANMTSKTEIQQVQDQCRAQKMGTGAFICKVGVKGKGGVVYNGGQCTAENGVPFDGKLGCFCGTVQVDTGTGHQSYSSSCGCNKETETTQTVSETLACTGITKDKATPAIGDVVQFTCAGTTTSKSSLTYQFQIKKDEGEWTALTASGNKASYTVATVGNYQVRCKACGTVNNASVCDPTWTGATQ